MEKAKKKHRFNVVDAAIIIVIAAILVTAVFFFKGEDDASSDVIPVRIEYDIEFRAVRDEFADNLVISDNITDETGNYRLGQIVNVQVSDALYAASNMITGEIVMSDYPDFSNIVVTVSAEAIQDANGRYALDGEYDISVGSEINVRTPNFNGTAYCIRINRIEGDS